MINKQKRTEVKNSAQELKDRIKLSKGEKEYKAEIIPGKKNGKPFGVRVFEIIDKKLKDRIIKLFSKVKKNGKDLTESFSALCEGLCVDILYGKPEELKQFKSEEHFVQFYSAVNELHILTREGCKAYGIELPEPEKEVKPPKNKKPAVKPTKNPGKGKPSGKLIVKTPDKLKKLLAARKASKKTK